MAQPQPPPVNINAAYFGDTQEEQQTFINLALSGVTHSEVCSTWISWVFETYFRRPQFVIEPESSTVNGKKMDLLLVRTFVNGTRKWAAVFEAKAEASGWPDTPVSWELISSELLAYCRRNAGGRVYAIGAIGHLCKVWLYDPTLAGLQLLTVYGEGNQRVGATTQMRMDLLTDGFWIEQKLLIIREWALNSL